MLRNFYWDNGFQMQVIFLSFFFFLSVYSSRTPCLRKEKLPRSIDRFRRTRHNKQNGMSWCALLRTIEITTFVDNFVMCPQEIIILAR